MDCFHQSERGRKEVRLRLDECNCSRAVQQAAKERENSEIRVWRGETLKLFVASFEELKCSATSDVNKVHC